MEQNCGYSTINSKEILNTFKYIQDTIDLSSINFKLFHEDPELWTESRINQINKNYYQFLAIHKHFPNTIIVPTILLDTYWHQHILDTKKYAADCNRIFGKMLHHDPYFGLLGDKDREANRAAFDETCQLWLVCFGESLTGHANPCPASDCR